MAKRIEITAEQYRAMGDSGLVVECKYYLVTSCAKTQKASKPVKRRSPQDILRMAQGWEDIALHNAKQESIAEGVGMILDGEHMASGEIAQRLARSEEITRDMASYWVGVLIKAGVLVHD